MDALTNTYTAASDPDFWFPILVVLKSLAVVISVSAIYGIIYAVTKNNELIATGQAVQPSQAGLLDTMAVKEKQTEEPEVRRPGLAVDQWAKLMTQLDKDEPDYKSIISEGDALVDFVLKMYGYPGLTMADRMRSIRKDQLRTLDELWTAHKVRNEIAHNINYVVSPKKGKETIEIYRRVLEELEAI
jgi:hypothetical protein